MDLLCSQQIAFELTDVLLLDRVSAIATETNPPCSKLEEEDPIFPGVFIRKQMQQYRSEFEIDITIPPSVCITAMLQYTLTNQGQTFQAVLVFNTYPLARNGFLPSQEYLYKKRT